MSESERRPNYDPITFERTEIHKSPETLPEMAAGEGRKPSRSNPPSTGLTSDPASISTGDYFEYIKQQGYLHEVSALKMAGEDAVLLDDVVGKDFRGHKFPTYDISSSNEIASVKSHFSSSGELSNTNVTAYMSDFDKMLGYQRAYEDGLDPVQQDAIRIAHIRDQGVPVPTELHEESTEKVANYLKNKSILRIPEDHVEEVRTALESKAKESPKTYYLPTEPNEQQIKELTERVQSSGMSSEKTLQELKSNWNKNTPDKLVDNKEKSERSKEGLEDSQEHDYYYGHGF